MFHTRFFLEDKLEFQRAPYYHLPSFEETKEKFVKFMNDIKSLYLSSDESEESSRCSFSALSDELILKILENLDWKSLCRVSRVDKRLNRISQDPHLYTYLKIEKIYSYNAIYTRFAFEKSLFCYFTPRCEYLRLLNLTGSHIEWSNLQKFLISCSRHLTHLRLYHCKCINDFTLSQIVEICQNLKELDLGDSPRLTDEGLLCLENLPFLECLCLTYIDINTKTLGKILRKNRRIRHLVIFRKSNHWGYPFLNSDDFLVELRNSCPDLESITLIKGSLTSQGIDALADCKNLRKVHFEYGGGSSHYGDSFHKLFSSCQRLEKINLQSFEGLTDYDLEALALCKNLKYLNVKSLRVTSLTTTTCLKILLNCPKLKKISLFHLFDKNLNETRNLFNQWIEKYSLHNLHVDLSMSLT